MSVHLLPEWAPQSGVLLTWPHAHGDWSAMLGAIEAVYVQLTAAICRSECALVVAHDAPHEKRIRQCLTQAGVPTDRVQIHVQPGNDTWARDYGPLSVENDGRLELLDFRFNGWGGKFEAGLDDRICRGLGKQGAFGALPLRQCDMVLEGGSIETDGAGTLLTTSRCLLSPTRNPGLDRAAVESRLQRYLGAERVLWLENACLAGDDTDGHIDMLVRFSDPRTLVHTLCDDPQDEHYEPHQAMLEELRGFRTTAGDSYRLLALPWPDPQFNMAGQRLPASYANFLILNDAVLVPTYRVRQDAEALRVVGAAFAGREVIGIDCRPVIEQYGSLHCLTMQLADGVLRCARWPAPPTSESARP